MKPSSYDPAMYVAARAPDTNETKMRDGAKTRLPGSRDTMAGVMAGVMASDSGRLCGEIESKELVISYIVHTGFPAREDMRVDGDVQEGREIERCAGWRAR
ncbi:uncharacterized protein LAESUDRAFT_714691 [Laetiporus sulphureus 93-53]|uniref:Uncharacterized protein n=1 Tax=Laetiporus sulphureus 93-53 TaxID=1314785 RepID=A0A165DUY1_9APHY|nr:uncharacterized protein LAESUDRAFT_714691 [Laetiporus sulphureus 93-53]KZT05676.1 hypothetical protein LAESUDRAFT_714691 [Laetiporus sulphureus 93-53]